MKLQLNLKFKQKRKDINFFGLQKKKQTVAVTGALLVLIPIVLAGAMFGVYTYNSNKIAKLNADFEDESRKLAAINLKEKQPILERAQVKRDVYATYYSWVDSLNTQLGNYKIIPNQLLEDITKAQEGKIVCTQIQEARNNSMQYFGKSPSYALIAKFQRDCTDIAGVREAFVTKIEKVTTENVVTAKTGRSAVVPTDEYEFIMTINFGDNSDYVDDEQSQE